MAKIVVTALNKKGPHGAAMKKARMLQKKRVRVGTGELKTLRTLDAGSTTFGDDLRYVFTRNVDKARDDNKLVTGQRDVQPVKR